jgi:hypothetical protein
MHFPFHLVRATYLIRLTLLEFFTVIKLLSIMQFFQFPDLPFLKVKRKVIPVTGRGGPQGCETTRPPHFLQAVGLQMAVSLSALRESCPLLSQEDSCYSYPLESESTPGP